VILTGVLRRPARSVRTP